MAHRSFQTELFSDLAKRTEHGIIRGYTGASPMVDGRAGAPPADLLALC
jgi:hypothetical protein